MKRGCSLVGTFLMAFFLSWKGLLCFNAYANESVLERQVANVYVRRTFWWLSPIRLVCQLQIPAVIDLGMVQGCHVLSLCGDLLLDPKVRSALTPSFEAERGSISAILDSYCARTDAFQWSYECGSVILVRVPGRLKVASENTPAPVRCVTRFLEWPVLRYLPDTGPFQYQKTCEKISLEHVWDFLLPIGEDFSELRDTFVSFSGMDLLARCVEDGFLARRAPIDPTEMLDSPEQDFSVKQTLARIVSSSRQHLLVIYVGQQPAYMQNSAFTWVMLTNYSTHTSELSTKEILEALFASPDPEVPRRLTAARTQDLWLELDRRNHFSPGAVAEAIRSACLSRSVEDFVRTWNDGSVGATPLVSKVLALANPSANQAVAEVILRASGTPAAQAILLCVPEPGRFGGCYDGLWSLLEQKAGPELRRTTARCLKAAAIFRRGELGLSGKDSEALDNIPSDDAWIEPFYTR